MIENSGSGKQPRRDVCHARHGRQADPEDPERINVYERWESEEQLLAFRGSVEAP